MFDDDEDVDVEESSNIIIVLIRKSNAGHIVHNHSSIDRCCKSSGWEEDVHELKFDGNDKTKRISCDISKSSFLQEYVLKRKFTILTNCTDDWKAQNWTFQGK